MSNQSKIDAYLTGALSSAAKEQFEFNLVSDETLFVEVEAQRALRRIGLQEQVEQVFAARQQQQQFRKKLIRRIAAGFLLFGLFSSVYAYLNPEEAKTPVAPVVKPTDSIEYAAPKPLDK
jgi:hypothetical protein